jgi:hypothetical protein
MSSFVLDLETKPDTVGKSVSICQRGSATLAQRDDRVGIGNIVDVERKQTPESPEVASGRVPPAVASTLCLETIEIYYHLDRPAIVRAEIH